MITSLVSLNQCSSLTLAVYDPNSPTVFLNDTSTLHAPLSSHTEAGSMQSLDLACVALSEIPGSGGLLRSCHGSGLPRWWWWQGTPPTSAGHVRDEGSISGSGRSPGGGRDNPLQYSCLENPHGQRSLAGYSPESCRVRHDRSDLAHTRTD